MVEIDLGAVLLEIEKEGKKIPALAEIAQALVETGNFEQLLRTALTMNKPVQIAPETMADYVEKVKNQLEWATAALAKEYILQGKSAKVSVDVDSMGVLLGRVVGPTVEPITGKDDDPGEILN